MKEEKKVWSLLVWAFVCLCAPDLIVGCFPQVHSTVEHQLISLTSDDLGTHGLAFITPSTVTGQEEEMQPVAFTFADVFKRERPDIKCVTLPETLGAVNRAGLAEDYKRMYEDYRNTGLFKRDILKQVGEVTGTRYLAQLKLTGFQQNSKTRLTLLGLRLFVTKNATIRLFFQIWDSTDGSIVWEGVEEMNCAVDSFNEEPVTLRRVLERAAENLVARLPSTG